MTDYVPDLITITASYDDSRSIEVRLNHQSVTLDDIADLIRVLHDPGVQPAAPPRPVYKAAVAPPNNPGVWAR